MKRLGDDDDLYGRPQFKRPFLPSRNESYVQSHVGGEGEGTSQRLTTNDALTYLKEVKEMFQDQKEIYAQFLEVMKAFKAQRVDTAGVIQKVKELFKGNDKLILGFNTFLPKGYEITLEEKKTVEFQEAIGFVNKIKKRFQHDEQVYKSFLDILNMYRKEHKGITEVYLEVASLLDEHPDLLDEFTRFLPNSSTSPSVHQAPHTLSSFQRQDERNPAVPSLKKFHTDRHRRDRMRFSHKERELSVDRPNVEADREMMKMHKEQRKHIDKEARERRHRGHADRELAHDRKSLRRVEGFGKSSAVNEGANNLEKSLYNWEFQFSEKVKERVADPDEYHTFLRCLDMYSSEIVSRTELQNLMEDALGKYPDLVEGFNEFLEHCENIESNKLKVEGRVKAHTREMDTVRETDRNKEKYLAKSIQELDLSNCEKCTPSYRLLPADYPVQRASTRSDLDALVLNDNWVSVTSGSEDYSFKHMRRNQYEESLFRCEDDRFELDLLLESVSSASKRVEELLRKPNSDALNIEIPKGHFSALNLRCIERLYGDHGIDTVDILRKDPCAALPVILARLKQKQEEWTRCRSDFNKVWADIYSKNHYKSLDHRSFYFKQQDSKNLTTKSLVAEIEDIKETEQIEQDVHFTTAVGYNQSVIPNLEFDYPDPDIHEKLHKLVHFSCEEISSTKEQHSIVMQFWTTFLESMLRIPMRRENGDSVDAGATNGNQEANAKAYPGGVVKRSRSPVDDTTVKTTREPLPSSIENENTLPESHILHGDVLIKENGNTVPLQTELKNLTTKVSCSLQLAYDQPSTFTAEHLPVTRKTHLSKICVDVIKASSGCININAGSGNDANQKPSTGDATQEDSCDVKSGKSENKVITDDTKSYSYHGASVGALTVEREEGELSPTVQSADEDPLSPAESHDFISLQNELGEALCSQDVVEENNVDANDEDSENVSMAGETSGSDSAGESRSHEEHEEDDVIEHEEDGGKIESEGEAEGLDEANFVVGRAMPSVSEHFLLNVKPLAKYVPQVGGEKAKIYTRVFYGNDNYYALLRLHQMLYERILFAKTQTLAAEVKRRPMNDINNHEPFRRFLEALYSLLDGSTDNAKFEDDCRSLIGNHSYVLFTLEKLIFRLVKQLQSVASDDMDIKLLQLYEYEKSRKCGNHVDTVYHENARVLLHNDSIYRFEFASPPAHLSIKLMDSIIEKPEVAAMTMDPNFACYLFNDFLGFTPCKRELSSVLLHRNKLLRYGSRDELSAMMESMDGVKIVNGLEYKLACKSFKISYVLDTEDYFFRSKRKRKKYSSVMASSITQSRLERFHRILHVFNDN